MKRIYLDDNGSSPASAAAVDRIRASLPLIGNPSSFHEHGRALRAQLDEARLHLASSLNARSKELIFCSGASEANRLIIDAIILWSRALGRPLRVLMSPFEHPSLFKPAQAAHEDGHFFLDIIPLSPEGALVPSAEALANCDVLLCCQAHNESGLIVDLSAWLRHVEAHTLVMSDVSQGFARLSPLEERVDIMTFSAQKMGGFAGMGGLIIRNNAKVLQAPWPGGGQERGFRPGTEAALLILAAGAAAREVQEYRARYAGIERIRDLFEEQVLKRARARIIGKGLKRLPNTSAICFPHEDPDALRIACDLASLSVGFGSACSGLAPEGSFALSAMGMSLHEQKTTVRFSFTAHASEEDALESAKRLGELVLKNG